MKWFFPSWSGDFRLEAREGGCSLTVDRPTPGELLALNGFLVQAKERGWLGRVPAIDADSTVVALTAGVALAGAALLQHVRPLDRTITAVRFAGGELVVTDAQQPEQTAAAMKDAEAHEDADAASVARPTPSCPDCIPGSVPRASTVLLSFLTKEEHETWARERVVYVNGGLSGHRYAVAHRHSPHALRWRRIVADLDDGEVLKLHDWSVPPEEEVLAAKLILEHREPWLRNEATCFGGHFTNVFKNPFGDHTDGQGDAVLTGAIGGALLGGWVGGKL